MRYKRKRALIVAVILIVCILMLRRGGKRLYKVLVCDEDRGQEMLRIMCILYQNGRSAGNLCEDFCNKGLLTIDKCLSHKDDNVIYSAKWRGKNIFLKAKKRSNTDWDEAFPENLNQDLAELRATFIEVMYENVLLKLVNYENMQGNNLRQFISPHQLLSQLYFNITPERLGRKEMQSLWFLLQQEEFYILQLLQHYRHIPRVYGTCWQLYALEEVKTLDTYGGIKEFFTKSLPWKTRVELMLELLNLVQELDTRTIYGTWQHCDIQPSNLGITSNGVIKIIDVDLMFTDKKIQEILRQPLTNCLSNTDCEFFDCASQCDLKTRTCLSKTISNNLKVVCRDLFSPKWLETGLLTNIPEHSRTKFDAVLKECSDQPDKSWSKEKYETVYNTLTVLLKNELLTTTLTT